MQYFRIIFESLLICPLFYNYSGNAIHPMLFNLISTPRVPSLPTYPWCWWWLERRRAVVRFVSVSVSDHLPLDICCGNTEQYTTLHYTTLHYIHQILLLLWTRTGGMLGFGFGRGHGQCSAEISGDGDGYLWFGSIVPCFILLSN